MNFNHVIQQVKDNNTSADYKRLVSTSSINSIKKDTEEILDSNVFDYLMEMEPDLNDLFLSISNNQENKNNNNDSDNYENKKIKDLNEFLLNELIQQEDSSCSENFNSNYDSRSDSSKDLEKDDLVGRIKKRSSYLDDYYEYEEEFDDDDDDDYENSTVSLLNGKRKRTKLENFDGIKKESNKDAATRYRMKKISEKDQLFETRLFLEKQNDDVKKRIDHVQTEINYLKNLLVQMLLTKGILGNMNNMRMNCK